MGVPTAVGTGGAKAEPMLIFDGDCGFCISAVRWVQRRWRHHVRIVAWQELNDAEIAGIGLDIGVLASMAWWIDPDGSAWAGHRAVGKALKAAGPTWGILGRLLLFSFFAPIGAPGYWVVAHLRHRLPGGTPACRIEHGADDSNPLPTSACAKD